MIQTSILTNNCDAWDLNVLLVYFKNRNIHLVYFLKTELHFKFSIHEHYCDFNPKSDKKC